MPPNIDKLKAKGNIRGLIRVLSKEKYFYDSTAEKAAKALGEIGDERAILPLVGAKRLRKKSSAVYSALERIIERSDKEKVIKKLNKSLKNDLVRGSIGDHSRMVIRFLGRLKHPGAVLTLIDILTDEPSRETCSARKEAALALGNIGDKRATDPLIAALSFSDKYIAGTQANGKKIYGDFEMGVNRAAEKALEQIGAPAVEPLISRFIETPKGSYERIAIPITISNIRDPKAVEALSAILQNKDLKSDIITEDLHRSAKQALTKINKPEALDVLQRYNQTDEKK